MRKGRVKRLEKAVNYSPDLDVRKLTDAQLAELAAGEDSKIDRWIKSLPDRALEDIVRGVRKNTVAAIYGAPDETR